MWARLGMFFATRAATGWALALGLAVAGGMWYAYDARGDKIVKLEKQLVDCQGTSKQAEVIRKLGERLSQQAREKSDDVVKQIEELPDDCYYLDGPSPLNGLRKPEQD